MDRTDKRVAKVGNTSRREKDAGIGFFLSGKARRLLVGING